jgi:hypothetical protein
MNTHAEPSTASAMRLTTSPLNPKQATWRETHPKHKARAHGLAIQQNSTGTTNPLFTTYMGAR